MTNKEYSDLVAKNLRRLMYEHGKKQQDLCKELGIKQSTLASWMGGIRTPKMDKIDLLCKYFNCRREDLMEPYVPRNLDHGTAFERNIILAYRDASDDRKEAVRLLLGLKEDD